MSTNKKKSKPAPKTVLVLRTVDRDRKAHSGFVWPKKGKVSCPDWDPAERCGNGLHGWLCGEGDSRAISGWGWSEADDRLWQVVEVAEADVVRLSGKVKFPRGVVLYTGDRATATKMISDAYPGAAVIGGIVIAGDFGTATAGNYGTATAGNYGKATAGYSGTATAGDSGTATAGYSGTATAGDFGTATAGYSGTATAGDFGTATAGNYGTATAGDSGTATAGELGIVVLSYYDKETKRTRLVVGYPGEDGIEAGKAYKLDSNQKMVLA